MGADRLQSLWGATELDESFELYRSVLRMLPDAVTASDLHGRITAVSRRSAELFGDGSEASMLGRPAYDFIAPEDRERAAVNLALTLERGEVGPVEYSMVKLDGSRFSGELCAARVEDAEGNPTGFVATVRDVTEKKLAQIALAESDSRYRTLVEMSPDAVLIVQGAGFRYVNQACTRLFGYTQADVDAGLRFLDVVPEHQRAGIKARYEARLAGDDVPTTYLLDVITKDGRLIPCETSARLIQFEGRPADLVIIRDLTERIRAAEHQRRLDARLQQAQKLESLGLLAGGVAHDFNNVLAGILGSVTLLRHDVPDDPASAEKFATIELAVQRASELCQHLLTYAGRRPTKTERVDLGGLVEETAKLLGPALPARARVVRQLSEELPPIVVDATQVRQAIMNLVTNAVDATEFPAGTVTLRTGVVECDSHFLADHAAGPDAQPGSYAYVEVTDTGVGMDAATLERAFEPFFTTKASGRGLGLASVRGCLRAHGGALEVQTSPGVGSTFRLLFPVERRLGPRWNTANMR